MTLLTFILVFGLILFFHELGHFLVARLFKIEVEEFGFGFPPRAIKLFTLGGTIFSLNWIPFGAFVRIKGENDANVSGGMANANPWVRLGIAFGGPLMNLIVGVLVFTILFMRMGAPNEKIIQIVDVVPNSPAAVAQIQVGDLLQDINSQPITSMDNLRDIIQKNLGKEIDLSLLREKQLLTVKVTPRTEWPSNEGPLGITMTHPFEPVSWIKALPAAVNATYEQGKQFVLLPVYLIRGQINPDQARIVGPKGIFDIYQEAVKRDEEVAQAPVETPAVNVLLFVGAISIALGLTNLLPIPALDGGRILFTIPEIITGRRVPAQYENLLHMIGFALLLMLVAYITLQDFINPVNLP